MTPEQLAAALADVAPGDRGKALDINHAFKIRHLRAGKLFTRRPPDFRSQLVNPPEDGHPATEAFFNPPKGRDHDQ